MLQEKKQKQKYSSRQLLGNVVILLLISYNLWLTMRLKTLELRKCVQDVTSSLTKFRLAEKFPLDATDAWTEVRVKKGVSKCG